MDKKLKNLLSERKAAVLKRWFNFVLETYPAETANFLKKKNDRFADPVGSTILKGLESLFEHFLDGAESDTAPAFLDENIRIRAVQDFSPSQAVVFVFLLKKAIKEELNDKLGEPGLFEALSGLESEIDKLALLTFDIYMKCREKIYELKANEMKSWTFRQIQRANQIYDSCKTEHDLKYGNSDTIKKG